MLGIALVIVDNIIKIFYKLKLFYSSATNTCICVNILEQYICTNVPYSGKVGRAECLANLLFSNVWRKKVWRMNRSAIGLSMVTINLVWQIADDSPNSPNFPPPNFPAIRYVIVEYLCIQYSIIVMKISAVLYHSTPFREKLAYIQQRLYVCMYVCMYV